MPTFNYGAGLSGNSTAAQSAYQTCISKGGSVISCGTSAWQAGLDSGSNVTPQTDCSKSWWPAGCSWLHSGDSLQPEIDGLIKTKGTGTKLGTDLTAMLPNILTIIIGVVFIAASLFLLKSPIQIVGGAVKEAVK
jgi:hypothetical protein